LVTAFVVLAHLLRPRVEENHVAARTPEKIKNVPNRLPVYVGRREHIRGHALAIRAGTWAFRVLGLFIIHVVESTRLRRALN
jgi:hypothetical protein